MASPSLALVKKCLVSSLCLVLVNEPAEGGLKKPLSLVCSRGLFCVCFLLKIPQISLSDVSIALHPNSGEVLI